MSQPTSSHAKVHVALGERAYDIEVGEGLLAQSGEFVQARRHITKAVLITDANVLRPHAEIVRQSLIDSGAACETIVVEPGERTKSIQQAADLWQKMLDVGADRKSLVMAVGGGVVGDLAGFIAATYTRGLPFVQAPTTLLAQVDSSVGGKTGVNLPGAKNMVGAFWQPMGVVIDTATLDTLPLREYRAGLAEVVKYGVILDAEFFAFLEDHASQINERDSDVLRQMIARCCRLKADVVEQDEREVSGLRAVLNYGHTFAHALEAVAGYGELLHGEAVSIGMMCAARLAALLGRVDQPFIDRQRALLTAFGLIVDLPDSYATGEQAKRLVDVMRHDKKVEHGRLRFVLPARMGHVELVGDVSPELAKQALLGG